MCDMFRLVDGASSLFPLGVNLGEFLMEPFQLCLRLRDVSLERVDLRAGLFALD